MEKQISNTHNLTRNWYSNKYQLMVLQKNLFSLFTICALVSVIIAVLFVKKITESKSFEPFVIEMEEKTGTIRIAENTNRETITKNESLKRYFIYSFINAVEGYSPLTYKSDINKVRLFSDKNIYNSVYYKISPKNPQSPVNKLKLNGTKKVVLKSIVFLTASSASIRFRLNNYNSGGKIISYEDFVAYMEFSFVNLNTTEEELLVNPLGFQVTKYRLDKDLDITK